MSIYINDRSCYSRIVLDDRDEKIKFIFVLDTSSSMVCTSTDLYRQNRHKHRNHCDIPALYLAYDTYLYCKDKLKNEFLDVIDDDTLITFSDNVIVHDETPDYDSLIHGGTDFDEMTICLTDLVKSSCNRCFIIMLTDGQSTVDDENIQNLHDTLKETGSSLHVIGFTNSIDQELLERYYINFGQYRYINNANHIKPVVDELLDMFKKKTDIYNLRINDINYIIKTVDNEAIVSLQELKTPLKEAFINDEPIEIIEEEYTDQLDERFTQHWWNTSLDEIEEGKTQIITTEQEIPAIRCEDITTVDLITLIKYLDEGVTDITEGTIEPVYRASEKLGLTSITETIVEKCIEMNIPLQINSRKIKNKILQKYTEQYPDFVKQIEPDSDFDNIPFNLRKSFTVLKRPGFQAVLNELLMTVHVIDNDSDDNNKECDISNDFKSSIDLANETVIANHEIVVTNDETVIGNEKVINDETIIVEQSNDKNPPIKQVVNLNIFGERKFKGRTNSLFDFTSSIERSTCDILDDEMTRPLTLAERKMMLFNKLS